MRRGLTGCLLLMLTLVSFCSLADEPATLVIANRTVHQSALPLETLRAIFAMRQRTLPDGQAVHVYVLPDDNPVHEDFSKKVLGVYPHQLRLAWDRAVFSGTGQAPNEVDDETEMLEAIGSTPGSIGYIQQSSLNDQVRVLDIE